MFQENVREFDSTIKWEMGQRIQEKRLVKKIAAVDIAVYLGIGSNQVSRIENGKANCTVPQLFILAQILECSVDYLLFGKNTAMTKEQTDALSNFMKAFS